MGNFLTTFIFSVSVAVWVYSKTQRRTGGIAQRSLAVAGVVFVMAFIFFYSFLVFVTNLIES
jgi:hypothetical protein